MVDKNNGKYKLCDQHAGEQELYYCDPEMHPTCLLKGGMLCEECLNEGILHQHFGFLEISQVCENENKSWGSLIKDVRDLNHIAQNYIRENQTFVSYIDASIPAGLNQRKLGDVVKDLENFTNYMNSISDENDKYEDCKDLREFLRNRPLLIEKTNEFHERFDCIQNLSDSVVYSFYYNVLPHLEMSSFPENMLPQFKDKFYHMMLRSQRDYTRDVFEAQKQEQQEQLAQFKEECKEEINHIRNVAENLEEQVQQVAQVQNAQIINSQPQEDRIDQLQQQINELKQEIERIRTQKIELGLPSLSKQTSLNISLNPFNLQESTLYEPYRNEDQA